MTGDLEDRVILDTMDDLGGPQQMYPEGFMSLSLFSAEICKLVVLVTKCYIQTSDRIQTDRQTLEKFDIDDRGTFIHSSLQATMGIGGGFLLQK